LETKEENNKKASWRRYKDPPEASYGNLLETFSHKFLEKVRIVL